MKESQDSCLKVLGSQTCWQWLVRQRQVQVDGGQSRTLQGPVCWEEVQLRSEPHGDPLAMESANLLQEVGETSLCL